MTVRNPPKTPYERELERARRKFSRMEKRQGKNKIIWQLRSRP
jgi:hypothetical protein